MPQGGPRSTRQQDLLLKECEGIFWESVKTSCTFLVPVGHSGVLTLPRTHQAVCVHNGSIFHHHSCKLQPHPVDSNGKERKKGRGSGLSVYFRRTNSTPVAGNRALGAPTWSVTSAPEESSVSSSHDWNNRNSSKPSQSLLAGSQRRLPSNLRYFEGAVCPGGFVECQLRGSGACVLMFPVSFAEVPRTCGSVCDYPELWCQEFRSWRWSPTSRASLLHVCCGFPRLWEAICLRVVGVGSGRRVNPLTLISPWASGLSFASVSYKKGERRTHLRMHHLVAGLDTSVLGILASVHF